MISARLLAGRARLWRTRLWTRAGGQPRARDGALTIALGLVLMALLTQVFAGLFDTLAADGVTPEQSLPLVAWMFTLTLSTLSVFDLHHVFTALLAGSDLDLLRAAPISRSTLATLLLLDALPHAVPPVLGLALPAMLGWMHAYGAIAGGAGTILLVVAALAAVPVAFGLLIALPLARWVSAMLVREALGLLATLTFVAAWLANAFLLPRLAAESPESSASAWLSAVPGPIAASPATWAARALVAGPDHAIHVLALIAALAGSLAVAWLCTLLHVETMRRGGGGAPHTRVATHGPVQVSRSRMAAFFVRDARLLVRDWTVAGDMVATALLWSLLPLLARPVVDIGQETLTRTMLVLLAVGAGSEIGTRALPLERDGLAWARLAPVQPLAWVLNRWAPAYALGLGLLLLGSVTLQAFLPLGAEAQIRCLAAAIAALLGATGAGLMAGAAFGDPAWRHPRAMLRLPGRLAGSVALLAQTAGWLLGIPWLLERISGPAGLTVALLLATGGMVAATTLALAAVLLHTRHPWPN